MRGWLILLAVLLLTACNSEVPTVEVERSSTATKVEKPSITSTSTCTPVPTESPMPTSTVKMVPTFTDTPMPTETLTPTPPPEDMVLIPAGKFQMGCDGSMSVVKCLENEMPMHTVYLEAYYIDRYEVSNAEYSECVAAGRCEAPLLNKSATRLSYYDDPAFARYPVVWASWNDADDYCAWAGKRLPTEAEWEKAARGSSDHRLFPWGNASADCTLANHFLGEGTGACVLDTTPVGSYPDGASPYGVMDMAGNVWEWVADWYDRDYYSAYPASGWPANPTGPMSGLYKVMRGGSYETGWVFMTVFRRDILSPETRYVYNGIRCALSQ